MASAAEDEETQRRGFVAILYHMHDMKIFHFDREVYYTVPLAMDWLPVRFVGVHVCFSNTMLKNAIAIYKLAAGKERRNRFRLHHGKYSSSCFQRIFIISKKRPCSFIVNSAARIPYGMPVRYDVLWSTYQIGARHLQRSHKGGRSQEVALKA